MFGFGKATRGCVRVADVTEATLRATKVRGTFNIATGAETPVSELFSILSRAAGRSIEAEMLPQRAGELERSYMDASRASKGAWLAGENCTGAGSRADPT